MQTSSHLLASSEEILSSLISFKSTPGTDGHGIIDWVSGYLKQYGLQVFRFPFPQSRADSTDAPANLFTTIGPQRDGGLCLSSHLDVVPASKENWTHPPFQLTSETLQKVNKADDSAAVRRLFGRGTTDMKGFAALVLALVPQWIRQHRSQPIHLAFTYDEESGCRGVPYLIEQFGHRIPWPEAVIVGEPTKSVPVIGHKGGVSCYTKIRGVPAHSSKPAEGASAIYIANDIINFLRSQAVALSSSSAQDPRFSPSYSTLSVGTVHGGTARNIIPEECRIVWEIRTLPGETPYRILEALEKHLQNEILSKYLPRFPDVSVQTDLTAEYPPLMPDHSSAALQYVGRAGCDAEPKCVTFGTEAGHYQAANIPAVVWGPGSIAQAHVIDEHIDSQDLATYLNYLIRL